MSQDDIKNDIMNRLRTDYMARSLYYYDKTDSTNLRIRQLAEEGAPEGTLAVADMQTAGKGRRGRGWISPSGMNIYMSLLLKPAIPASDASMITLIAAMAVAGAVRDFPEASTGGMADTSTGVSGTPADIKIKWPNDIVVGGRKVCGILTEMDLDGEAIRDVIVGIGINVNQDSREEFPEEIRETASSLRIELGTGEIDRGALIARIMDLFEKEYDEFIKCGDLSFMKERYDDMLAGLGGQVRVLDPKGEYTGMSRGMDERGRLLVETDDKTVRPVYAGEVSVRGLYGYV
ncbi:BirA family transcriptional regulator, biotin operon repressor / biotin-[acetyl-CoA-carboxylase] ligase [Lachnospiraceae bacterium XBB2008]|nr:BirA family transcriptional regulator, biotin operon repressor / biotin-[acetyl-CoA-carboxylase] ligase [Lachnospiraceae bacterium XBB2008]